jgi:hypothetical protein
MAQDLWAQGLSKGCLLPVLWDFDIFLYQPLSMEWNYELLARELAQEGFLDMAVESGKKVPIGLRNRCRIWKLVEEMYIGDVSLESIH